MPDYLKILIPGAIGLVTTVCAAFLSARWGVRRAFAERWWDRKVQAYSEIIDALHDMLRYSAFVADRDLNGDGATHPKEQEFATRYTEAYWKLQRMTDIGAFVISEKAAHILQKLRDRPKLNWEDGPTFEIREEEAARYREALNGIRKCAKADLNV